MPLKDKYHSTVKILRSDKFNYLADVIEKTYKSNPYKKKSNEWTLWQEQCIINLPILYLASLYLYKYGKEKGYLTYLFTARDGCHWHQVFHQLFPDVKVHYLNVLATCLL